MALAFAASGSTLFGMEEQKKEEVNYSAHLPTFYSQPCGFDEDENGKPGFKMAENPHNKRFAEGAYRIKNMYFESIKHDIKLWSDPKVQSGLEQVTGRDKNKTKRARNGITYNIRTGRWSDENKNGRLIGVADTNDAVWPSSKFDRIVTFNNGIWQEPKAPEPVEVIKEEPKKDNSPTAKEEVKEANKKNTDPEKKLSEPSPSLTPERLFFIFSGVGIIGGAIFAAVQYAKKQNTQSKILHKKRKSLIIEEEVVETLVN